MLQLSCQQVSLAAGASAELVNRKRNTEWKEVENGIDGGKKWGKVESVLCVVCGGACADGDAV